jgi:serine/threonine protein phosphatase 1
MPALAPTPFPLPRARPRVPKGIRVYVIGDIHGRDDLLWSLLQRIDSDVQNNPGVQPIEIYLGDYIDRGPASRQVIDRLIERRRVRETVYLKGNHETYIATFLHDPAILTEWAKVGGFETLLSYGLTPSIGMRPSEQTALAQAFRQVLPDSHRLFLLNLTSLYWCGDFFFAHAGVRPGIPFEWQRDEDLLWIRDDFLYCVEDFGKIVVHGHTPVQEPDIRPNRINIDTGAYATGRLTCLVLQDESVSFL